MAPTILEVGAALSLKFDKASKAWEDFLKTTSNHYNAAVKAAFTTKELKNLERGIRELSHKARKEELTYQKLLEKEKTTALDALEQQQKKAAEAQLEAYKAEAKQKYQDQEDLIKRRMKAAKQYKEIVGEELDREMFSVKKAEALGDGIADAFNQATSKDLKAWSGMIRKLGGISARFGAKAVSGEKEPGGVAKTVGGLLTGFSKLLMPLAAIVGGIMAIAKVLLDADAAAKELNRTLLESGVAGADLADKFGMVSDNIDRVRRSFTEAVKYNIAWGVTAKDTLAILGAFGEAGLTYKEITAGAKNAAEETERLQKATEGALAYSKLLGMTSSEVAQNMATYMEEFGLTLRGVEERFSAITMVAKESGFATKRFFNMVLQATSGMSMYNVRLEEAAELLIRLGKALGEKTGGEYLQGLVKGFQDESTQDRIKKTMTTGIERSLDILKQGAVTSAEELQRRLLDFSKDNKDKADQFWEAIGKAIGTDKEAVQKMDPRTLAEALSKLPTEVRATMLAQAEAVNAGLARTLAATQGKAQAFKGGIAGAQAARQFASPGEALYLQVNELARVLGKRVDQIDLTNMEERMAWENLTGKSGEAAQQLFEVAQRFAGINNTLGATQEELKGLSEDKAYLKAKEFNDKYAKTWGVMLDTQGKVFKAQVSSTGELVQGREVKNLQDLYTGVSEAIEEGASVPEDIALAREIADNTRELSQIMDVGIGAILENIYGAVQSILTFLGLGDDKEKQKAKKEAIEFLRVTQGKLTGKMGGYREAKVAAQAELKKGAKGGRKKQLEAIIEAADKNLGDLREKKQKIGDMITKAGEMGEEEFTSKGGLLNKLFQGAGIKVSGGTAAVRNQQIDAADQYAKSNTWFNRLFKGTSVDKSQAAAKKAEDEYINALSEDVADPITTTAKEIASDEKKEADQRLRDMIDADKKLEEDKAITDLTTSLIKAGVPSEGGEAEGVARAIRGGYVPPQYWGAAQSVASKDEGSRLFGPQGMAALTDKADDLVLQIGRNGVKFAQRVDPGDVGVFAKAGGALSQAGGKGTGNVNIFHLYNDGPGILKSIEKAQQAGVIG